MSDIGRILDYYECGAKAFQAKQYLESAIWFRDCYLTFEYGELSVFMEEVNDKGHFAKQRYDDIVENFLSPEELDELKKSNATKGIISEEISVNFDDFWDGYVEWSRSRFEEE